MTVALISLPLRMALSCFSAPAGVLLFQFHWEIDSLILCTALLAVSLWALYALRMRYVAKRMLELMESRTEERIRASQREHDVLLQAIQGLVLRFHYVTEALPEDHPSRPMLRMALQRADGLIIEARNRGEELRSLADGNALHLGGDRESDP